MPAVEPTFYKTNACQKLKCETIFWVKTPAKTHLTPEELHQTLKMMPAKPISFRLKDSYEHEISFGNYLHATSQKGKIAKASSYKFISDVLCNAVVFNLLTVIVCQSVRAKTVLVEVVAQVMSKWSERMSFIKAASSSN